MLIECGSGRPFLLVGIVGGLLLQCIQAQQTYYFSGAVQVWQQGGQSGSLAVPAQCPADHPVPCNSIGAADWCCAANNDCQWNNAQVACCPHGQMCFGAVPSPTTYYTTPQQPPQTIYVAGAAAAADATTTQYIQPQTTTTALVAAENGQYCSTLYAEGPGLPTTARGECGTILVTESAAAARIAVPWAALLVATFGGLGIVFIGSD